MVLNQNVEQMAQAERDPVLGERLPEFDDRNYLWCVNALCKEVQWNPVLPMDLAQAVTRVNGV